MEQMGGHNTLEGRWKWSELLHMAKIIIIIITHKKTREETGRKGGGD
jgi:hypothetical protein